MAGGRFLATALAGWRAEANDGPQVFGQGGPGACIRRGHHGVGQGGGRALPVLAQPGKRVFPPHRGCGGVARRRPRPICEGWPGPVVP
eukprot:5075758-Lingulodinium_polyedra.AAC.1